MTHVKICGLSAARDVAVAVEAGAAYLGFVFFPKSPRSVTPEQARVLCEGKGRAQSVALVVDAEDAVLETIVRVMNPDMIQCHGTERAGRVGEIKARFARPVIKAVSVGARADLDLAHSYEDVADMILLDAKPVTADLPGGTGQAFDWHLLAGHRWKTPWMLAGGLTPETVAGAVRETGAPMVDVSSGVERARGVKAAERIRAFLAALGEAAPHAPGDEDVKL